jgi:Fe2+ or Zn2+ uptake regulation protein
MSTPEALIELLRQSGRKITPQRRAIIELLVYDTTHPTAEEIYQRAAAMMPDMSRATVYNTLHELVALDGLIETHVINESGIRYDTNLGPHHHLICTQCHALVDISHDFAEITLPPREAVGYQIIRHQITFYGLCPTCQERNKEQASPSNT